MNETRRLAEFVATTTYADLPSGVVDAIKIYILDDLAAGFRRRSHSLGRSSHFRPS